MADVIKFDFNQPVEVALKFSEPRVFPSQFEGGDDRHMFSTTDGRVMYVTPLTSARIKALKLAIGECFWLMKRKDGRVTEFLVSRDPIATDALKPVAAPRPTPFKTKLPANLYYTPGPTLEEQLTASIDAVERRKSGEQRDGTFAIPAPAAPDVSTPAAAARLAPAIAEFSARLIAETNALVDVYAAALATAGERHGNAVKPDDIRSFVVTAYINASKTRAA